MTNMRILSKFAAGAIGMWLCGGISNAQAPNGDATGKPKATKTAASQEKPGRAGPRLYNKQLDDEAQSALTIAKDIANGALFDKELHNVDLLSQQSLGRIFTSARRLALARIGALFTWQDVEKLKEDVRRDLSISDFDNPRDLAESLTKLSQALDTAKKKIKPAEGKDTAASIFAAFKAIGGADSAFATAEQIRQKLASVGTPGAAKITHADLRAANEFTKLFGQLSDFYDRYKAATAVPSGAANIVADTQQELVSAELDHVSTLLQIAARRDAELVEASSLLNQLGHTLDCIVTPTNPPDDGCSISVEEASPLGMSIEVTLRQFIAMAKDRQTIADHYSNSAGGERTQKFAEAEEARKKIRQVTRALYLSAAVASRGDLPVRLSESRTAQEEHRYAIRCNAILAQSYERVVASGVERLALYYKGGLKPEVVAQLVQSMATLGLIPAVVTR